MSAIQLTYEEFEDIQFNGNGLVADVLLDDSPRWYNIRMAVFRRDDQLYGIPYEKSKQRDIEHPTFHDNEAILAIPVESYEVIETRYRFIRKTGEENA